MGATLSQLNDFIRDNLYNDFGQILGDQLNKLTLIEDWTHNIATSTFLTQTKIYNNSVTSPGNAFKVLGI